MWAGAAGAYAVVVSGSSRTWTELENLLRRATQELERAARAGSLAGRHERLAAAVAEARWRELHEKMAMMHRGLAQRHLTAARIHRAHAERLRGNLGLRADNIPPAFMAAVAETSGADSALLSLFGHHQAEALVVTSDKIAAAAHDLEVMLDEGPGRDAVAGREMVTAAGEAMEERWPLYGPAAARLGIRAAAAAPLGMDSYCLGSLTVFGLKPGGGHDGTGLLGSVADALTHTMLLGEEPEPGRKQPGPGGGDDMQLPVPGEGDHLAVVNQAAGMVAAECGCGIADALAIIRAHAFAHSEPVDTVASRVVRRQLRLCSDALA